MLRSLPIPKGVLAIAFVLGCGDQPLSTGPASTLAPTLSTVQNAAGSGAFVVRSDTTLEAFLFEADGYTVVTGLSPTELARSCVTGEVALDPATVLNVFRPDGSIHQVLRAKQQNVLVWDEPTFNPCATPPFASGTGQFIYTDNDLFVSMNRGDSFGFRIHGEVRSGETGQRYHLLALYHAILGRPNDPFIRETSRELKLVPVGG